MKIFTPALTLAASLAFGGIALAADPCQAFKWDVAREVQLFATTGTALAVAASPADAPSIATGQLYALTLLPQESVRYDAPPTKRMLDDGAFGGVLKLRVPTAGAYRVAIDSGFWLDVVRDGKPLDSVDFNGSSECAGPRKIVVYDLPAGTELTLQLAAASGASARLSVTPVAAPAN